MYFCQAVWRKNLRFRNMLGRDFTFAVQYNTSWLYQQLLAFHVGLWLKPKNLLNALKTDPLILFTLPLGNRVKIKHLNSNASAFVLYLKKKKQQPCRRWLLAKRQAETLFISFSLWDPKITLLPLARSLKTHSVASSPGVLWPPDACTLRA